MNRRNFLAAGAALPLVPVALTGSSFAAGTAPGLSGRLYKTLKIGMIREGKTFAEKFAIAKEAGFEGVELSAPGFDIEEVRKAIVETGLPVDGSVCAEHWEVRHSDPDAGVRKKALETLLRALETTHAVGGHTVLLVVGHGKDGSKEDVDRRSIENIAQAVPLAAKLGVTIAIENVWNEMGYDPAGGEGQTADQFVEYVDAFRSPWVGMQFDIGNHWKYGPTGDWIRQLGKRIVKLDIKGFSRESGKFTAIGEGDIDYPDVNRALLEIGFHGWCAAEVAGGDAAYLEGVASEMDQAFGLA